MQSLIANLASSMHQSNFESLSQKQQMAQVSFGQRILGSSQKRLAPDASQPVQTTQQFGSHNIGARNLISMNST